MSQPRTLHLPSFSAVSYTIQNKSPLFTTLPPELRSLVFTFALSPYEDNAKSYAKETYWTRPGYNAPHRTCTALLRTCKAIYAEAWYLPFALAEHTIYLSSDDRAPRGWKSTQPIGQFAKCLELLHKSHSVHAEGRGERPVETGDIRIFPQLYMLEPGNRLQSILSIPFLRPSEVRVTIRYTDFWFWEGTEKLRIEGRWVDECVFPESVKRVVVDFEMIERRKEEVDIIVGQALEKWVFKRKDDRVFTAKREDLTVSRWTGSSMFGGVRWVRDEVRPGQLDYYVLTATWKVNSEKDSAVITQSPTWRTTSMNVAVPKEFEQPMPPFLGTANITRSALEAAGVSMDMPAQESYEAVIAMQSDDEVESDEDEESESGEDLDDEELYEEESNDEDY
ncbi:uncharacterized protein BDV14DRAFT_182434 [Aspergillus stella-maris]|uniref:uncharacterized protein n=1 Tax=Aspergillus stella-maris TaxID=1810926 RepID=UPI003CCCFDAC